MEHIEYRASKSSCGKCNGLLMRDREEGLSVEKCLNCGSWKYLDVSVPIPTRPNGARSSTSTWNTIADQLPDTFKIIDLLRRLWQEEDGWTVDRLQDVLATAGYVVFRSQIDDHRSGPLMATRNHNTSH